MLLHLPMRMYLQLEACKAHSTQLQHTATANTMHGERKTVTKAIGGTTITVVVEHIDGWLIREVHRGGVCTEHSVDALTYPTPEAAINAGIAMALLMQKPVAAG